MPGLRPGPAWERADEVFYYAKQDNGSDIVSHEDLSNDDVVDILNDLLENARDGEYGFRTSAEQVETAQAKQLFASRAEVCRQAGEELMQLVRAYGGEQALDALSPPMPSLGYPSMEDYKASRAPVQTLPCVNWIGEFPLCLAQRVP